MNGSRSQPPLPLGPLTAHGALWHYGIVQLNIHVPREREAVIAELEAEATASGRAKNQIVLDALTAYLRPRHRDGRRKPRLRTSNLGAVGELRRADLYEERSAAKHGSRAG